MPQKSVLEQAEQSHGLLHESEIAVLSNFKAQMVSLHESSLGILPYEHTVNKQG